MWCGFVDIAFDSQCRAGACPPPSFAFGSAFSWKVEHEGAAIRIVLPRQGHCRSNGVIQDVSHNVFELFFVAKEMVPEALLPNAAMDTVLPRCPLSKVLELGDEGDDVAARRCAEDKMDVVGHKAEPVDWDVQLVGKAAQYLQCRTGKPGIREDSRATIRANGCRADGPGYRVGFSAEAYSLPLWKLMLHDGPEIA